MAGTLNSSTQFPLEASSAGIAAAGAAALSRPEVVALALPHEAAAEPGLAASAVDATAAAPESAAASAPAAEAAPASDAAAAQDAEAAAFVAAQEAGEAPLAAQPGPANSSWLAGEDCSATLDLLDLHPSYSIFRSLLATAGKQARPVGGGMRLTLEYHSTGGLHAGLPTFYSSSPPGLCRPGGRPHLARPPHHLCAPQQVRSRGYFVPWQC